MSVQYTSLNFSAVTDSGDYIILLDTALIVRELNTAAANRFFVSRIDAIGNNLRDFFDDPDDDYRIAAFKECVTEDKTFFFPNVNFLYTTGKYSHLIIPVKQGSVITHVLSIMREQFTDEEFTQEELLSPLLLATPG
jgi:PAS domain-containing protein